DNRRVIPPDEALLPEQLALRATIEKLGALRRACPTLRRGDRTALFADRGRYAYARDHEGDRVIVLLSADGVDTLVPPIAEGSFIDLVTGETIALDEDVIAPARGFRILVAPGSPCANAF